MNNQLWTRSFCMNMAENFILYMVFYLTTAVLAEYAMSVLGAPAGEAGLAVGLFVIAGLAGRILSGRWASLLGIRKLLCLGLILYGIGTALYFLASTMPLLYAVRLLQGFGFGMASTATGSIAAAIIPAARKGEGLGYYALSLSIASAVGPFIGIHVYQSGGMAPVLLLSLVCSIVTLLLMLFLTVPKLAQAPQRRGNGHAFQLSQFIEYRSLPISAIAVLVGIGYASLLAFLASYLSRIQLSTMGSFFFIVYAMTILASRPFAGKLFDVKGQNAVMVPLFLLFAAGLVLLAFSHTAWMILAAGILIGLGYGNFPPMGNAIALRGVPPERIVLATSTFFCGTDIGIGMGPFLLGLLLPFLGFHGLYLAMAVLSLIELGLYWILYGRNQGKSAPCSGHQASEN